MNYKAWVAKAAKRPMVLEAVDLGPLGAEDVEVAVEHRGLYHSDLSVLNNDFISFSPDVPLQSFQLQSLPAFSLP